MWVMGARNQFVGHRRWTD